MRTPMLRLMLPTMLTLACADPKPVALDACKAIPQLATDDAGKALLAELLEKREVDILNTAAPTLGVETLGAEGLAGLRAAAECAVVQVDSAGSNRWAVKLTRTLPVVNADGSLGAPATQDLEWQVVDAPEGIRVESGLRHAASTRADIDKAVAARDYMQVAASWRGLVNTFSDPVLPIDAAAATRLDDGWAYRKAVLAVGAGVVDPNTVAVQVQNTGTKDVADGIFTLKFTHAGTEEVHEVPSGPIAAGATVQLQVAPSSGPLGADVGGFKLEPLELRL